MDAYILNVKNIVFDIQKQLAKLAHDLFELEDNFINSKYFLENTTIEEIRSPLTREQLLKVDKFFNRYKTTLLTLLEKSGTWEFPGFLRL